MNFFIKLKDNIASQPNIWIIIWVLVLLNIFTFLGYNHGFSFLRLLIFLLLAFGGIKVFKSWSRDELSGEENIPEENSKASELMIEVRLMGEEIFDSEIDRLCAPVVNNIEQDFAKGLDWLWEDKEALIERVQRVLEEVNSIPGLVHSLNEEKAKLIKNLINHTEHIAVLINELNSHKNHNIFRLEDILKDKVESLKSVMRKEQDIFYDYVHKLLLAQMRNQEVSGEDEQIDIKEYFNVNKLGEQFALNLEKSLETRLLVFQDGIIRELENFSADVVGKLQNSTLQLRNDLKEMEEIFERLLNECKDEDAILLKRLNQSRIKVDKLEEQAEEMMLTLAWQDILVEKRWDQIEEKLAAVKDRVNETVDNDVIAYISKFLAEEIKSFAAVENTPDNAAFYKSMVDAELIYQLHSGDKLPEIIQNGVYSMLQFIRPMEILVKKYVRLSENGNARRREVNVRVKSNEFEELFGRIIRVLENKNNDLVPYIENLYPRSFNAFCNNPYIKQKPENLNQAAWSLFMDLVAFESDDKNFLLVGLLLLMHQLRNRYIHPFKATPIDMETKIEIDHMRYACFQAVDIILGARESSTQVI